MAYRGKLCHIRVDPRKGVIIDCDFAQPYEIIHDLLQALDEAQKEKARFQAELIGMQDELESLNYEAAMAKLRGEEGRREWEDRMLDIAVQEKQVARVARQQVQYEWIVDKIKSRLAFIQEAEETEQKVRKTKEVLNV